MWPFKKYPEVTVADIVKDKPDVLCGNKELHYQLEMFNGVACPTCRAIKKQEREAQHRAELAKLIAAELAPLLIAALAENKREK